MDSDNYNNNGIKTNVIVNYLPQNMMEEEVHSLFSTMGDVDSTKLMRCKKTGNSFGYAFINYKNPEDADKAIKTLSGLKLQNKIIRVSYARPSSDAIKGANLYVCGLPQSIGEQELMKLFAPFGRIIQFRLLREGSRQFLEGQSNARGLAFVRYDQRSEAEEAIRQLNGTIPKGAGAPITVKFSNPPGNTNTNQGQPSLPPFQPPHSHHPHHSHPGPQMSMVNRLGRARFDPIATHHHSNGNFADNGNGSGWSLFVFNLYPDIEESTLWRLFGPMGAVQDVKIIKDKQTNKCKGFGFVKMVNYDEAKMAVQILNGHKLADRVLQVSFKTNKMRGM